jgi:hypothetical protein
MFSCKLFRSDFELIETTIAEGLGGMEGVLSGEAEVGERSQQKRVIGVRSRGGQFPRWG